MSVLTEIIKAEIAVKGVIPFARFMELALYCPEYGFYEKESDTVGRAGDFYTSVSVGPLFGELLAFQFAEWMAGMTETKIQIVEAGAHDGKLAVDILGWLKRCRPTLGERVEYVIVEPSLRRRAWQQKTLAELAGLVRWVEAFEGQSQAQFTGVIFGNELLDAMPVHRVIWDSKRGEWFELGVTWEAEKFVWRRVESLLGARDWPELPSKLLAILPDGFMTELCPAAVKWWRGAAESLSRGRLLTLDYGLCSEDFFSPQRVNGTLRAYRRHKICDDLLADPGEQDITAHVNFSQIQNVGEQAGLKTELFASQAEFIVGIATRFWAEAERQGDWNTQRNRELQTLMHPEHLGRAFRILGQRR